MKMIEQSDKTPLSHSCRGNAMVYILVALALIGFLTLTLSNQNNQADGQDLSDEMAEFYASELMNYVASAQQAIDMMLATGTEIDELDFVRPSEAAFNTGSHIHKVFHPQGGGLNYEEFSEGSQTLGISSGLWAMRKNNVEWTPTTRDDVILTAYDINRQICEQLNKSILGSKTIPIVNGTTILSGLFTNITTPLTTALCPDCEGYPSICVTTTPQTGFVFYNIIAAQ